MIKQKKLNKRAKFHKNNYHLWTNGRLLSIILIGLSLLFLILSIIALPVLSAIPGYTFGFLFGYYSYIFYIFIIYYSTCKLFNINIYLIKKISKIRVLHYSWLNVFTLTFGIMLLIETSLYINKNNTAFPGVSAWSHNFNQWWKNFTSFGDSTKPNITNSGVITNLILSILYSLGGTIVAIIFSLILISYFFFYLFYSSPIKNILNKKAIKKKEASLNKEYETKIVDLSFENENKIIISEFGDKIIGENTREILIQEGKKREAQSIKGNLGLSAKQKNQTAFTIKEEQNESREEQNEPKEVLIEIPFDNPFEEPKIIVSSLQATEEIKVKERKDIKFEDTEFLFSNIVEGREDKNLNVYNETQDIKVNKKRIKRK